MFRRKLLALGHANADTFNGQDESEFRNLIIWLEDQKIRYYKIEERDALRNMTNDKKWNVAFTKYLKDINCTVDQNNRNSLIDWLLGFSVRLKYGDNAERFRQVKPASADSSQPSDVNPFEAFDFDDDASIKAGIASLASLLRIPHYHNHKEVLKAICTLVQERLSKTALASQSEEEQSKDSLPLDVTPLGFSTADSVTDEGAKVLRLLHVRNLRDFQTKINEAIVSVQTVTADPQTDQRLGKVGR